MDETNSELEALLTTTKYVPAEDYEAWYQERMGGLLELEAEPEIERANGLLHLANTYRSNGNQSMLPRHPVNVLSFAALGLAVITLTALVLWPALNQEVTSTPAAHEPENMLAATATPIPTVAPTPEAETRLSVGEVFVLPQGVNVVTDVAFSPDGKLLAIGGEDSTVVWDLEAQNHTVPKWTYDDMRGINQIAFSIDGTLAIGGDSGTIRLVDPRNPSDGVPSRRMAIAYAVNDLAFSADGTRLIAAYMPGLRDALTGEVHHTEVGSSVIVWDMTSHPQEGRHYSHEADYVVISPRLIKDSLPSGGESTPLETYVQKVAINATGTVFAVGTNNGMIRVYNDNGGSGNGFWTQANGILGLSFNTDTSALAVTGIDNVVNILTLKKGVNDSVRGIGQISIWGRSVTGYRAWEYSSDGTVRVEALVNNTIRVSYLEVHEPQEYLIEIEPGTSNRRITSLAFSPSGNVLAIGTSDGSVWLWRWR